MKQRSTEKTNFLKTLFTSSLLLLFTQILFGQSAKINGIVFDEFQTPMTDVSVFHKESGTQTNANGFYQLSIPANQDVEITVSYVGKKKSVFSVNLNKGEVKEINPVLKSSVEQMGTVVITKQRKNVSGITTISPKTARKIPGANAGVENLLKTLPGVNSNNELSTQYSVRGGNYDENLVYVNGIQVYRPFLIRSGQQEGLSFVNTDMTRNVDFSAGGFQAKYGDRLSSVLDISYREPKDFGGSLNLSLLGGRASVEGVSDDDKFTGIVGVRYRNNELLVDSKDTETNFKPRFTDAQTYLTYQFSEKFKLGFLGNISRNEYDYEPYTRETNFGTLQDAKKLLVFYDGKEEDVYETYFGALKATYDVSDNFTGKLIGSIYHTKEQEYYDILKQYRLGKVNTDLGSDDLGDAEFTRGVGSQFEHARNKLDALIVNVQHKGDLTLDDHVVKYGLKYTHEDIRDRLREYEIVDSTGYSIRPPMPEYGNDQPYNPYEDEIEPYQNYRADNSTKIDRFKAFAQWSYKTKVNGDELFLNAGIRSQYWTVSGKDIETQSHQVVSPRAQVAYKPDWETDMLFRLSGGFYHQPPFYRALRDSTGSVKPNVKAQQSVHYVLGNDYSFKMDGRPFKLTTEAYYKDMTNINPYTLENVRIRYEAKNNAKAYAYGLDLRLNGEFVPGLESWVSASYLRTEENINNRGYIPRPTDQRLKFSVLFQDYVPEFPKLQVYLNMVYNTGLPGGTPNYSDPYDYVSRLPDYFRADAGFSYLIVDPNNPPEKDNWLASFKSLNVGVEIFNLFDRKNSITSTFVRDVKTRNYTRIKDYLTTRVFNVRLGMKF